MVLPAVSRARGPAFPAEPPVGDPAIHDTSLIDSIADTPRRVPLRSTSHSKLNSQPAPGPPCGHSGPARAAQSSNRIVRPDWGDVRHSGRWHGFVRGDDRLFLDDDGPWCAFVCSLPHSRFQVLGDLIYGDTRNHLIFIILKDLWTNLVTVSVAHTQVIIDFDFHALLLQNALLSAGLSHC
jgi:hypothetical protein